jgi:hypothetical protein
MIFRFDEMLFPYGDKAPASNRGMHREMFYPRGDITGRLMEKRVARAGSGSYGALRRSHRAVCFGNITNYNYY